MLRWVNNLLCIHVGVLCHCDSGADWYFCTDSWLLHFLHFFNYSCSYSTLVVNKSFIMLRAIRITIFSFDSSPVLLWTLFNDLWSHPPIKHPLTTSGQTQGAARRGGWVFSPINSELPVHTLRRAAHRKPQRGSEGVSRLRFLHFWLARRYGSTKCKCNAAKADSNRLYRWHRRVISTCRVLLVYTRQRLKSYCAC